MDATILVTSIIAAIPGVIRTLYSMRATVATMRAQGLTGEALLSAEQALASAGELAMSLLRVGQAARAGGQEVPGIEELEALADSIATMPDRGPKEA